MPVVKTEKIRHNGADFKKIIRIQQDGIFRITLPAAVSKDLAIPEEVKAKTQKEVEDLFDAILKEHTATKKSTKLVIYYSFKDTSYIWDKTEVEEDEEETDLDFRRRYVDDAELLRKTDDISFVSGTALMLYVAVFQQTATKLADGRVLYSYEHWKSTIPRGFRGGHIGEGPCDGTSLPETMMDWTPEREKFFAGLCIAMEDLIMKLAEITGDNAKLMLRADTGKFLLTAEKL